MTDYGTFRHGGVTYPLPTSTANSLLRDADPSLFYVLDYFQTMLNTYMGPRLLAEAAKNPAISAIAKPVAMVCPFDPAPFLQETQFKFPILAIYRKKDKFVWKTIGLMDDVSEWAVDYILPPMTSAQAERVIPILRSVGVILMSRIENTFDPNYMGGQQVWKLADLEEIYLDEASYGTFSGTGNLVFPAWRGKLMVKEVDAFKGNPNGFDDFGGIDSSILVFDSNGAVASVLDASFITLTKNFYAGFDMQQVKIPLQVPLVNTSPGNITTPQQTGVWFPASFYLQVDGSFAATYVLEGSLDGVTWTDITNQLVNVNTGASPTTITAAGLFNLPKATPPFIRIRCSAYTSGSPAMQIAGIS